MKRIVLILIFISFFYITIFADESSSHLTINLIFPKKSTSAMTAPRPRVEPEKVSGLVFIDINPAPAKIEKDRYLVEYFLDEKLIYQTTGFDEQNPAQASFAYILDTTKYKNGFHKLIINFWDKPGSSAIGIREIIIYNDTGNINE